EARIDRRHMRVANWVLQRKIIVNDLLDADINNNDFLIFLQQQFRAFPGDLSLGITFPGDLSPGKRRWGTLVRDSFPSDNPRRKGKLRLLDNGGNPLVPTGIMESDSEVESIYDETASLRISTSGKDGNDKGYGTNSLLEQLRDSYPDNDDYDPYDDDMYEDHDLSEHLQSICDDLDITVRGRKKK
nr:two-pore potassium channel 5 [Tanacetum cinerariifolium]